MRILLLSLGRLGRRVMARHGILVYPELVIFFCDIYFGFRRFISLAFLFISLF
jgi:hypothetical protein